REHTEARNGTEVNVASGPGLVVPAELDGLVADQQREHGTDHQRDEEGDGVGDHAARAESGMMRRGARTPSRRTGRAIRAEFFEGDRLAIEAVSDLPAAPGGYVPSASSCVGFLGAATRS